MTKSEFIYCNLGELTLTIVKYKFPRNYQFHKQSTSSRPLYILNQWHKTVNDRYELLIISWTMFPLEYFLFPKPIVIMFDETLKLRIRVFTFISYKITSQILIGFICFCSCLTIWRVRYFLQNEQDEGSCSIYSHFVCHLPTQPCQRRSSRRLWNPSEEIPQFPSPWHQRKLLWGSQEKWGVQWVL